MQRVEARRRGHEFAVQTRQTAAAHPRIGAFEHGDTACRFETDDIGDKACIRRFDLRTVVAAGQRGRHILDERRETRAHGATHLQAGELRKHQSADGARADDADHHFSHPRQRAQKRAVRML